MTRPTRELIEGRITRHVSKAASALEEAQRGVLADAAARGMLRSGPRLKRQAEVRNEQAANLVEWCLLEVGHLPGDTSINWTLYGPFVRTTITTFLAQSRDGLRFEEFGPAAASAIASILDNADAHFLADLEEFGASLWRPRKPPGGANVTTNNSVVLNNSTAGTIQQSGQGAHQEATANGDVAAVRLALEQFSRAVAEAQIAEDQRAELLAEIETLRPQLTKPKPNVAIVRETLGTMRRVAEGAAGGVLTEALVPLLIAAATVFGS